MKERGCRLASPSSPPSRTVGGVPPSMFFASATTCPGTHWSCCLDPGRLSAPSPFSFRPKSLQSAAMRCATSTARLVTFELGRVSTNSRFSRLASACSRVSETARIVRFFASSLRTRNMARVRLLRCGRLKRVRPASPEATRDPPRGSVEVLPPGLGAGTWLAGSPAHWTKGSPDSEGSPPLAPCPWRRDRLSPASTTLRLVVEVLVDRPDERCLAKRPAVSDVEDMHEGVSHEPALNASK